MRYAKPKSIDEALALLADGSWTLLAGGTDFYPAQGNRPVRDDVLDLNGLQQLRHISQTDSHYVFGARATWTDIINADLPPAFDALKLAAREVGSIQIQNSGTIAGNLCNASPAADGVPPLLALSAEVVLQSAGGERVIGLSEFILGNRRTARAPGELVTAVRVPREAATGSSHFVKLGARRYLVISIAMAAARVVVGDEGKLADVALSVGACSAVAMRLHALEERLREAGAPGDVARVVEAHDFAELTPIDDVRGSAGYRRHAAREIVLRALSGALADGGKTEDVAA